MNTPTESPGENGKTIILQPGGSSSDAWVLAPKNTAGGTVMSVNPEVVACGSGTDC